MQDRFKFRIWDKKANKYREKTHNQADTCLDVLTGKVLYGEGVEIYGEEEDCDVVIEQCTGLKDKNGNLIYEGDIVKDTIIDCGVIQWNEYHACFMVVFGDGDNREFGEWDTSDFEVIGNINENIDLLENKDE